MLEHGCYKNMLKTLKTFKNKAIATQAYKKHGLKNTISQSFDKYFKADVILYLDINLLTIFWLVA